MIHDCWNIITSHKPWLIPHPPPNATNKGKEHIKDDETPLKKKKELSSKGPSVTNSRMSYGTEVGSSSGKMGNVSLSGVLLDMVEEKFVVLSIEETAFQHDDGDDNDTSVLDTTMLYGGDVDEQATNAECKKCKWKIKKWDKKACKALGIILWSLHPTLLLFIG
jgi:hypothetical protein